MKMTGRQRTRCAINHMIPDTVPIVESLYCRALYKDVLGYDVDVYNAYDLVRCAEKVGYDLCFVPFGGMGGFNPAADTGSASNVYKDEYGVTYKKDPASWPTDAPIVFPLTDGNDWKNYVFPDPWAEQRLDGVKTAMKLSQESGIGIFCNVRGPYTGAWMLFGLENFSYLLYDEPEIAHEVLTAAADFSIVAATRALEQGVDAVMFADDYGSCAAPLISPAQFNEFVLPQLVRLNDAVAKKGGKLIMHSDGNIRSLLPGIRGAGISGYHPIERAAHMDLAEIKREFGRDMVLLGNVNNKTTLVTGTPEEVDAEVKECIRIAAPGGGFILTSDHSIHDDTPLELVYAMYDAGRKYGRYPIELD